jgi:hypothetical protein
MSTAHPVFDADGEYWPVFRVGSGLGNVADATAAQSYILMNEDATMFPDTAKDGKVKAELGDDPEHTGEYSYSFTLYPLGEKKEFALSTDIFTQGVYWTHNFDPTFNVDVYYMFNDVDDKQPESAERAHFADASTSLHTAGLRFFGKYSIVDYSLEGAHQFGRGAYGEHLDADMIDARLNIHLYDDSDFKPILGFNYTHFSGDDPGTGRLEGWNPLMTQCPLWGEELMPIMLNGMWSNLESLRTFVSFNVINDLKFTLSATDYLADEKNSAVAGMAPTGGGDHVGLLLSAIASYKIMDNMSILGYVSHFMAGDYFANGHDSYWFRLELNYAF